MLERFSHTLRRLHITAVLKLASPSFLSIPITLFSIPLSISAIGIGPYGQLLILFLLINQSHILLFGADKNLIRMLIQSPDYSENNETAATVALIYGCCIACIIILTAHVFELAQHFSLSFTTICLLAFGIPVHFLWSLQRSILQAKERFGALGAQTFVYSAAPQYVPLLVILIHPDGSTVSSFLAATLAMRCSFLTWGALKDGAKIPRISTKSFWNIVGLIRYGKWLGMNQAIQMLFDGIDRYLVGFLISPAAVALYSIPLQAAQKLAVLPVSLAQIVFNRSIVKDQKRSEQYLDDLILLAPFCGGIFFSLCGPLFEIWLGDHYVPLISTLGVIIFLAISFTSMNFVAGSIIEGSGGAHHLAKLDTALTLPLICLMAYLTYAFGPVGTAVSLLSKELLFFVIRLLLVRPPVMLYVKTALASVFLGVGAVAAIIPLSPVTLVTVQASFMSIWWLIIMALNTFKKN